MSKESKIYLFKDRKDYIKKLTNDNVINVIGTKGSGKTTSTLKYDSRVYGTRTLAVDLLTVKRRR